MRKNGNVDKIMHTVLYHQLKLHNLFKVTCDTSSGCETLLDVYRWFVNWSWDPGDCLDLEVSAWRMCRMDEISLDTRTSRFSSCLYIIYILDVSTFFICLIQIIIWTYKAVEFPFESIVQPYNNFTFNVINTSLQYKKIIVKVYIFIHPHLY